MKLPGLPDDVPPTLSPASHVVEQTTPVLEGDVLAPVPRREKLSGAELVTIGLLETRGRSVAEIAEAIGRAPATVRANRKHARELMAAFAPEMVELWIGAARQAAERGNHHPMRDFLAAAGVSQSIQPSGHAAGPQMQVNIGIALPGLPAPQPRTDESPEE